MKVATKLAWRATGAITTGVALVITGLWLALHQPHAWYRWLLLPPAVFATFTGAAILLMYVRLIADITRR